LAKLLTIFSIHFFVTTTAIAGEPGSLLGSKITVDPNHMGQTYDVDVGSYVELPSLKTNGPTPRFSIDIADSSITLTTIAVSADYGGEYEISLKDINPDNPACPGRGKIVDFKLDPNSQIQSPENWEAVRNSHSTDHSISIRLGPGLSPPNTPSISNSWKEGESVTVLLEFGCENNEPVDKISPAISFYPATLSIEATKSGTSRLRVIDDGGIPNPPIIQCTNGGTFIKSTFTAPTVMENTTSVCTATATDVAGNTASGTLTVSIRPKPDTTKPAISFSPAALTLNLETATSATSKLTIIDDGGVPNPPVIQCTEGGSFTGTTFTAPAVSQNTTSVCTATATDVAGNLGSGTLTVLIRPTLESCRSSVNLVIVGLALTALALITILALRIKRSTVAATIPLRRLSFRRSALIRPENPHQDGLIFPQSPLFAGAFAPGPTPVAPAGQMVPSGVYEFYKHYLTGPECGGIEFIAERDRDASDYVPFNGEPPLIISGLDIAIFTLARAVTDREPIDRVAIPTTELDTCEVVTVSYPCPFEVDETILSVVEKDPVFAVKRLSQGRIFRHSTDTDTPYGVAVKVDARINPAQSLTAICHNASTLGGSSGAPILDLSGRLVGVHFAGDRAFNGEEAANLAMAPNWEREMPRFKRSEIAANQDYLKEWDDYQLDFLNGEDFDPENSDERALLLPISVDIDDGIIKRHRIKFTGLYDVPSAARKLDIYRPHAVFGR